MIKGRDERQPLLPNEPLNDSYDKRPPAVSPARPDVRTSPDSVLLHLPGQMETPEVGSKVSEGGGSDYDPLLERNLEHPTS